MDGSKDSSEVQFDNPVLNDALNLVEKDLESEEAKAASSEENGARRIKPMPSKGNPLTRFVMDKIQGLGSLGSEETSLKEDLRQLNSQLKSAAANVAKKKSAIKETVAYIEAQSTFKFLEAELQALEEGHPDKQDVIESKRQQLESAAEVRNDIMDKGLKSEKDQWEKIKLKLDSIQDVASSTKMKMSKALKDLGETESKIDDIFSQFREDE